MEQKRITVREGTEKISPYEFQNQRDIVECILPLSVKTLGTHCFYDCRNLGRLVLWDQIETVEDGFLKNCLSLKEIEYMALNGHMYALKSILADMAGQLTVTIFYGAEREKVKLLFPRYLHDYEENTMARIINQVTYGSGAHYRECINKKEIDYPKYDRLFSYAAANEEACVCYKLALYRLKYPRSLWDGQKQVYSDYIYKHYTAALEYLEDSGDMELFEFLAGLAPSKEILKEALFMAQRKGDAEFTSLLLSVNNQKFGAKKQRLQL